MFLLPVPSVLSSNWHKYAGYASIYENHVTGKGYHLCLGLGERCTVALQGRPQAQARMPRA